MCILYIEFDGFQQACISGILFGPFIIMVEAIELL